MKNGEDSRSCGTGNHLMQLLYYVWLNVYYHYCFLSSTLMRYIFSANTKAIADIGQRSFFRISSNLHEAKPWLQDVENLP